MKVESLYLSLVDAAKSLSKSMGFLESSSELGATTTSYTYVREFITGAAKEDCRSSWVS